MKNIVKNYFGNKNKKEEKQEIIEPVILYPIIEKIMLKYTKIREVKNPERGHIDDSGIDFYIPNEFGNIKILPGENIKIPLGIKVIIPKGYDMTFFNKSGIASKHGLIVGACIIDNGYRGELILNLINLSKYEVKLEIGHKIVQGVIRKCEYLMPEEICEDEYFAENITTRCEEGFGSTGI